MPIENETALPDSQKLMFTIETLEALAHDGFSNISSLASVALKLMETPDAYIQPEMIAKLLNTIRAKAEDMDNLIGSEAEAVGCVTYRDIAAERRYEARRAAAESRR
ncbi:hypothetical protein [Azonexus sp. IMCC34839]|uniref:hypothetical protein n=1 Tax=Azonexus sp. IMCC34839 TaxID=3133695 RepID=UPI00399A825E